MYVCMYVCTAVRITPLLCLWDRVSHPHAQIRTMSCMVSLPCGAIETSSRSRLKATSGASAQNHAGAAPLRRGLTLRCTDSYHETDDCMSLETPSQGRLKARWSESHHETIDFCKTLRRTAPCSLASQAHKSQEALSESTISGGLRLGRVWALKF